MGCEFLLVKDLHNKNISVNFNSYLSIYLSVYEKKSNTYHLRTLRGKLIIYLSIYNLTNLFSKTVNE